MYLKAFKRNIPKNIEVQKKEKKMDTHVVVNDNKQDSLCPQREASG